MPATQTIVPLHLSGNTTEQQNQQLQSCLGAAVQNAYQTAIERLDRQSVQAVLEAERQVKADIAKAVTEIVYAHTISSKYQDEEVSSDRGYPSTYSVRPVEAQVTELRKAFPGLGACQEKLGRVPLPEGGPEAWFAIPRWEAVAPTYNEAVERILEVLGKRRRFANRIAERLGKEYLRQTERSRLRRLFLPISSGSATSWWSPRRQACCIAALRPGARALLWLAMSFAWAFSPSQASSSPTPSASRPAIR